VLRPTASSPLSTGSTGDSGASRGTVVPSVYAPRPKDPIARKIRGRSGPATAKLTSPRPLSTQPVAATVLQTQVAAQAQAAANNAAADAVAAIEAKYKAMMEQQSQEAEQAAQASRLERIRLEEEVAAKDSRRRYDDRAGYRDDEDEEEMEDYPRDFDSAAGSSVSGLSIRSKMADRRQRQRQRQRHLGGSRPVRYGAGSRERSLARRSNGRYVLEAEDDFDDGDVDGGPGYSEAGVGGGAAGFPAAPRATSGVVEPDRAMLGLLEQLGLAHHTRSVVGLGCSSLRHLLDLTPPDMQAIGLAPLEARRLAQAIAGLRGQPSSTHAARMAPSPTPSSPIYPTSSMTVDAAPPPSVPTTSRPPPQQQHIGSTLAAASAAAERQHGGAFAAVMRFAEKVGDDDLLSTVRSHSHTAR
jgi:hypothetical protein